MAAAQRLKEMIRRQAQNDQSYKSSMGEAMAVVKKSSNPKEDFKRSMLEMISEREIYDGKELEELLQCLLSLNSRQYHSDIVEAFSDIWKVLFL
ncbi:Transcription repressor OFP8 [Linum perenne]